MERAPVSQSMTRAGKPHREGSRPEEKGFSQA
jgi:hypothetical protein